MKLIVGLGNPGKEYANNRHNLGFLCLNYFAKAQDIQFDKKQAQARVGSGEVAGIPVVVAKPQTFVNASGQSVRRMLQKFNLTPDDLLVIHDDLDLPLGKIRLRQNASSGGHKGIDSIISSLGSRTFFRIRVGIGRPKVETSEEDTIAYVLSDFTPEEKRTVSQAIPRVTEAIVCLLTEGLAAAMNKYN